MNNDVNNNENQNGSLENPMNIGSIGTIQPTPNLEATPSSTNPTPTEVSTPVNDVNLGTPNLESTPKINEAVENVNVEDNILGEKKKSKLPIIIIIIILLVVLCFVGYKFLYKKDKGLTSKEVFSYSLNKISDYAAGVFNGSESIITNTFKQTHKINVNLNSKSVDMAEVSTILKKLEVIFNAENDMNAKYLGANVKINYDNAEALDAKVMLNDKYIYFNLGSLYDKNIRYEVEGLDQLMEIEDNSDIYIDILNEIINTIKNELKDEYFSQNEEKLNNQDVIKYTLTINSLKEYINNIVKSLKNNTKLANDFEKLDVTKEELNNILDNLLIEDDAEDEKLVINVYLTKKKEMLKLNIIENDEEVINIVKEDSYIINVLLTNELEQIGTFKIEKNYFELNINYDGVVMNITTDKREKVNKNSLQFKVVCQENDYECENIEIKITQNGDDKNGTLTLYANIPSSDIELTINDEYEFIKDAPVTLPDFNNYIDYDALGEAEAQTIQKNLSNNSGLLTLMNDLGLMEGDETKELLNTSCITSNNGKINYTDTVDNYRIECHDGMCQVTDTMTNELINQITCNG